MKKFLLLVVVLFVSLVYGQTEDKNNNNNNNSLSSIMGAGVISVTIGGDFIITGTYPAFITERVDQFVTRMYNQTRERLVSQLAQQPEVVEKIKKEIESYSLRNITLKRSNGVEINLDLMKFRRTGDFTNNPYLKNDDVLIFPPSDLERNFFSINGAVNKPGKYHFRDGDKLSDAIELAQGINKAYENVTKAEINRLSYNGEKMEIIPVDINSNYPLQRGDRIIIVANETQKKEFSVTVIGEVNVPGKIPITKSTTTLRDVINKAGGFTDNAFLKQAKIFTGNTLPVLLESVYGVSFKDLQQPLVVDTSQFILNLKESIMYRMSNVTYEDRDYFKIENQLRSLLENGSVDFSQINNDSSEAAQYVVKDGDLIFIPQKQNTVYIFGQVVKPGHVVFKPGMDYKYYLNKAGGIGEFGKDEDEIMVIKGDSREWISPYEKKVIIEEGDFIYMPRKNSYPFNYYVNQVANYFSIIASVATLILLLYQFSKK